MISRSVTDTAPMHLVYLSDAKIPSRSSNSMQTMRMCAAFQAAGAEVTLVHPVARGPRPEGYAGDVAKFYGVPANFERKELCRWPRRRSSATGSASRTARILGFSSWFARRSRPGAQPFVCYSRSFLAAWIAVLLRALWLGRSACRAIVVEVHDLPQARLVWRLLERTDGVVVISEALRSRLLEHDGLAPSHVWVEHDGADLV